MNNKGLVNEIFIVIIIFLVAIGLLGIFWLVGTVAPVAVGEGQNLVTQVQGSINQNNPNSTLSNATNATVQVANSFLGIVQGIIYMIFLGLLGGFIAVCYYVRTYKFLAFAWVGLMIFLVFASILISTAYQQAATGTNLSSFYTTWGTNNFIFLYLPQIVGGLTVLTGIILFAIISTDSEETTRDI